MFRLRLLKLFIITGILLTLNSCTALNSGVGGYFGLDTDLELVFKVDADINPDEGKKPSPLFIRLYELKSPKMFKRADFIDIYERDKDVLGADLINQQKLKRIIPGEDREDHFVLDNKTRYVGLYAEFLRYKDSSYRLIVPVVPNNVVRTTAVIHISGNTIKLDKDFSDEEDDTQQMIDKAKSKSDKANSSAEKFDELLN